MIKIEDINESISVGMLDFGLFSEENKTTSKREMERKGVLFLIEKMLKTNRFEVVYNEVNKPFLKGRQEKISISHSHNWLVIALNKKEDVGVDIELIREKVLNIKHKFLAESELLYANVNIEVLTLLWAAKEAIYKAYGKKEVEFKNILIDKFVLNVNGELLGNLKLNDCVRKYKLMYKKLDNYILALVTNEI